MALVAKLALIGPPPFEGLGKKRIDFKLLDLIFSTCNLEWWEFTKKKTGSQLVLFLIHIIKKPRLFLDRQ